MPITAQADFLFGENRVRVLIIPKHLILTFFVSAQDQSWDSTSILRNHIDLIYQMERVTQHTFYFFITMPYTVTVTP